LPDAELQRLATKAPSDLCMGAASTKTFSTLYFDTPEFGLRAAGITLRVRKFDDRWIQTVKVGQQVKKGLSNPIELEAALATCEPDLSKINDAKVRRAVQKAANGTILEAVFETVVERTVRKVEAADSVIELAIDRGEVRAESARDDIGEAELELKSGDGEGLLYAADCLLGDLTPHISASSKAEKGYRLALGMRDTDAVPRKANAPDISRRCTSRVAVESILLSATDQVFANRKDVSTRVAAIGAAACGLNSDATSSSKTALGTIGA